MADHRFVAAPTDPPTAPRTRPGDTRRGAGPPPGVPGTGEITLRSWTDPSTERRGHDPRSRYVERFWLGVLGPSATWLLRRLQDELDAAAGVGSDTLGPKGVEPIARVDLVGVARQMGMSYVPGRESAFSRAIQRCVMFGVAHHTADGLAVRRRVPPVAERHLRRLPPEVAMAHDRWVDSTPPVDAIRRARLLANAMIDAGDCVDQVEAQLVAVGVEPAAAEVVADDLRRARPTPARPAA